MSEPEDGEHRKRINSNQGYEVNGTVSAVPGPSAIENIFLGSPNPRDILATILQEHSADETLYLLKIFPEELWIIILNKVNDPLVLYRLASSSYLFRYLLKSRRVEYLFHKVLPILVTWCSKTDREEETLSDAESSEMNSSDEDDDSKEESTQGIQKLEVLPLRQVCFGWEKAVECLLLEHPSHRRIDRVSLKHLEFRKEDPGASDSDSDCGSGSDSTLELQYLTYFKAHNTERLEKFCEEYGQVERNALFHRKLVLQDHSGFGHFRYTRVYWEAISAFLTKLGHHIWFCEIRLERHMLRPDYYLKIRDWLKLMPNLRTLLWTYPLSWSDLEDEDTYDFSTHVPVSLKCEMEERVNQNPLPTLEHLQVFKTDDLPYPIFREFIIKNPQLEKLQFHRKFPPPLQYEDFYKYNFSNGLVPNVRELSVVLWNDSELKNLEFCQIPWARLEKLNLYWADYYMPNCDGFKKWEKIFRVVEKRCGGGTVKDLLIRLPQPRIPVWKGTQTKQVESLDTPVNLRLIAPSVRRLEIILPEENATLDFLLPVMKQCLQELHIVLQCEGEWRKRMRVRDTSAEVQDKNIIQFLGYHERMLDSNIWDYLPKLKLIGMKIVFDDGGRKLYTFERRDLPKFRRPNGHVMNMADIQQKQDDNQAMMLA